MGIFGPPHNETASAPATAIISAHETKGKSIYYGSQNFMALEMN